MNLFKEVNIVYYIDLTFEFEYFWFFLKKPTVSMPCLVMELSHHLSLSSQNKVYHDVFDTRCEMHPAMIMDKEGGRREWVLLLLSKVSYANYLTDDRRRKNVNFAGDFFSSISSALCILQATVTTRCNILSRQKNGNNYTKSPHIFIV